MIQEIYNEFTKFKTYPNRNKMVFFLISCVIFFVIFLWSVYSLLRNDLTSINNTVPNDGPGDAYNISVEKQIRENEPAEKASYRVTEFIKTLPYTGELINLSYSYGSGEFKLVYKTKDFNGAKLEFKSLLSENGIKEEQIKKDLIDVYEYN